MANGTSATPRKTPRKTRKPAAAPRQALRDWRMQNGHLTWVDAGEALGVPWHRYRRWELGECVPLMGDAIMLEKKTGIKHEAWLR